MLIYEKNNKLNINFDNEVSEQPDLQISKEGDKTQILVDGKESGGGSGGVFYVTFSKDNGEYITDKSIEEIDNLIPLLTSGDLQTVEGTLIAMLSSDQTNR
jgi:hypothetical protein